MLFHYIDLTQTGINYSMKRKNSKLARYRRFHYEPRFYDEVKDDIAARRQRIREQVKSGKTRGFDSRDETYKQNKKLNIIQKKLILWMIAILFIVVCYFTASTYDKNGGNTNVILGVNLVLLLVLWLGFIRLSKRK